MITPNMEALSLVELQYIAKKQGINGSDWMKREDLIEALEEIFEDDTTLPNDESSNFTPSNQRRFLNSLVEHKNKIVYAKDLASLLDLPRDYVYKYIKNLRAKIEGENLKNADKGGFILNI